jgi:hypothetical protein
VDGLVDVENGEVEIPVMNNGRGEVKLEKDLVIANLGKADLDQFLDIGGHLKKLHDAGSNILPTCPCISSEARNKIIITNEYGISKMGPKWQKFVDFKPKATSRIIKDKIGNAVYLIPGKNRVFGFPLEELTEAVTSMGWMANEEVTFLYGDPAFLTDSFWKLFHAWICKKKGALRYVSSLQRVKQCQECQETRLELNVWKQSAFLTKKLWLLFIIDDAMPQNQKFFEKQKGSEDRILNYSFSQCARFRIQCIKTSEEEIRLAVHIPEFLMAHHEQHVLKQGVTQLLYELREIFPHVLVNASFNPFVKNTAKEVKLNRMVQMLVKILIQIQFLRGRTSLVQRLPRTNNRKEKLETIDCKVTKCSCYLCISSKPNVVDRNFYIGYEGPWPIVKSPCAEAQLEMDEEVKAIIGHNVFVNSIQFVPEHEPDQATRSMVELTEDEANPNAMQWLDLRIERKTNAQDPISNMDWEGVHEPARKKAEGLVKRFADTLLSFNESDFAIIKNWSLDLELVTEEPFQIKPFPQGYEIENEMKRILNTHEMTGLITRASKGTYLSPCFLVLKNSEQKRLPEGVPKKYRLIIDYRTLNQKLKHKHDKYSIYGTNELIHRVGQIRRQFPGPLSSILFTTMDIKNYFYSICVTPESRKYLAFRGYGTQVYEPQVLPMGVSLAPAISSEILLKAIRPEVQKYIIKHIDDIILITPCDVELHGNLLQMLWEDLEKLGILLAHNKIKLFRTKIEYLGVILNGDKVEILPDRIQHFSRMPMPNSKKALQQFLGVAGFMSNFINSFQLLVALLTPSISTRKTKFELTEIQKKAIQIIRKEIDAAPSLFLLDSSAPLFCCVDSSQIGCGAVFCQVIENQFRPIKFYSAKYTDSSARSLHSSVKELLAILTVVQKNSYLSNLTNRLIIITDLKLLTYVILYSHFQKSAQLYRFIYRFFCLPVNFQIGWLKNTHDLIKIPDLLSRDGQDREDYSYLYNCYFSDRYNRLPDSEIKNISFPPHWHEAELHHHDERVSRLHFKPLARKIWKGK